MTRSRLLALAAIAAVSLAACGSGDDSSSAPAPIPTANPDVDGPTSPIPDEVPDEFLPAIGPIDVLGDPLPVLPDGATVDNDPARGLTAPVIVGLDFSGNPVRIDAAADGPTMVAVVAHWCPHCNQEVPRIVELGNEGALPEGLNVVAVSTSPSPDRPNFPPGDWLADVNWAWPALADGVSPELDRFLAAEAYGVSGFPFVLLLDGDGTVAARWSGETDGAEMVDRIERYLEL